MRPMDKSRSKRRVYVRTPSGTVKKIFAGTHSRPKCAICKSELAGIPKEYQKLSKTKKTVNRPYGGSLCSKCMRRLIIAQNQ